MKHDFGAPDIRIKLGVPGFELRKPIGSQMKSLTKSLILKQKPALKLGLCEVLDR